MKKLDITELKNINGSGFSRDLGYALGRAAGMIVAFMIGSRF